MSKPSSSASSFCMMVTLIVFRKSSWEIMFGQKILKMWRRHLYRNISSFCSLELVVVQHSETHRRILRMLLLKILILGWVVKVADSHPIMICVFRRLGWLCWFANFPLLCSRHQFSSCCQDRYDFAHPPRVCHFLTWSHLLWHSSCRLSSYFWWDCIQCCWHFRCLL